MSRREDKELPDDRLEQAVEWFLRMRSDSARIEDLSGLQSWLESDPQNAVAYRKVSASWNAVGAHAAAAKALVGRRGAAKRWAFAACIAAALTIGLWLAAARRSQVYSTGFGERHTVTLQDGSVVALDARSRIRVRYTKRERRVDLEQGQARFTVAKNPSRPFRVHALDQTVVAIGTQFNVDLVSGGVFVTLIEGRVAVSGITSPPALSARTEKSTPPGGAVPGAARARSAGPAGKGIVELTAGEGLRISKAGRATLVSNADPDHASAWQYGRIYFDNEPLASAAARLNRYARRRIQVDPSIANLRVSGIFDTDDVDSFVVAVTEYFPIRIDRETPAEVHLTARQ